MTLRTTAHTAFRHPRNLQILRRACLSDPDPTHHHIFPILHPVRHTLLPFAFFPSSHVSLIAASASLVAYSSPHLPIPPGPAASAANGQAGLRARPSNASLQPEAGSPYNVSTYSGVSSYASSSARSPMLPYTPYSPASVPPSVWPPHALWRHERLFRNTGGTGALPGLYAPGSAPAAGGMRTPATAVTWGCRHRDLVHPSLEFSNLHPDCRRAALQLRLCRGIQRRRLTRGVVIEPVYDAVLQAGAFLSVLPTKILYFPSCLRVANDGVSFIRYFVNWACTLYDHRHRMSSFIWG